MSVELEGLEVLATAAAPSKRCFVIVGATHGNEPAGIRAINMVRSLVRAGEWKIDGNVYGLIGNPRAVETGARFTQENLNRAFGRADNPNSYEAKRAVDIATWFQSLAKKHAEMYLLDLHSVSMGETRITIYNSANPKAEKWAREISPIPFFLGETDEVLPGALVNEFEKVGGIALAIECGNHGSETGATVALEHIERAFESLGMLKESSVSFKDKVPYDGESRTYTLTAPIKPHKGFVWDLSVASELRLSAGTQFAHDDLGPQIAQEECYIMMPSKVPQPEDFDAGFLAVKIN
jgi:predicted deacylase